MGALTFLLQVASPSPTPAPIISAANWTQILAIISAVVSGLTGIVANPYLALGTLAAVLLSVVGGYFWITGKIKAAEDNAAKNDTNNGYDNQVDNRIPVNQQDNQDDNNDRNKIDQVK